MRCLLQTWTLLTHTSILVLDFRITVHLEPIFFWWVLTPVMLPNPNHCVEHQILLQKKIPFLSFDKIESFLSAVAHSVWAFNFPKNFYLPRTFSKLLWIWVEKLNSCPFQLQGLAALLPTNGIVVRKEENTHATLIFQIKNLFLWSPRFGSINFSTHLSFHKKLTIKILQFFFSFFQYDNFQATLSENIIEPLSSQKCSLHSRPLVIQFKVKTGKRLLQKL